MSDHVETGRHAARGTIYAIAGWFAFRSILDTTRRTPAQLTDHVAQAAVAVACGAVTAVLLAGTAASPAQLTQVDGVRAPTSAPAPPRAAVSISNLPAPPLPGADSVSPPGQPGLPSTGSVPVRVPGIKLPPIKLTDLRKIV